MRINTVVKAWGDMWTFSITLPLQVSSNTMAATSLLQCFGGQDPWCVSPFLQEGCCALENLVGGVRAEGVAAQHVLKLACEWWPSIHLQQHRLAEPNHFSPRLSNTGERSLRFLFVFHCRFVCLSLSLLYWFLSHTGHPVHTFPEQPVQWGIVWVYTIFPLFSATYNFKFIFSQRTANSFTFTANSSFPEPLG